MQIQSSMEICAYICSEACISHMAPCSLLNLVPHYQLQHPSDSEKPSFSEVSRQQDFLNPSFISQISWENTLSVLCTLSR